MSILDLPGTRCGSFACFYTNEEVETLNFLNIKSVSGYTATGNEMKLSVKSFNETFKSSIQRNPTIGIRVESITGVNEQLQSFLNVNKAFGNDLHTYTTYQPLLFPESGASYYVFVLHFKSPMQFSYYRKGITTIKKTIETNAIVLSMHQSCQTNMADLSFTDAQFKQSMQSIRNALNAYHAAGKYHGDIKLRNMVVCDDAAKLIDFYGKTDAKNFLFDITRKGINADFTRTYHLRTEGDAIVRMEATMYDKACFNIVVAHYCTTINEVFPSIQLYKSLEFPEATNLIQQTTLTIDYSYDDVVQRGLSFIRRVPMIFGGVKTQKKVFLYGCDRCIYKAPDRRLYVKHKGVFIPYGKKDLKNPR